MLIDVSNYQGSIDWGATHPAIGGAYLKITEGTGFVDGTWRANHDAATATGTPIGAYHFADLADPTVEANHFADQYLLVGGWQLRPVLDIETPGANAQWVSAFRQQFRARTNSRPFRVYSGLSFFQGALNPAGFLDPDTDLWVAAYRASLGWNHPQLVLWQNTESASVPGVLGSVDADQFMNGWTPAADLGVPDMEWNTPMPGGDWGKNPQDLQSILNHIDQRVFDLHRVLVEPGGVIAHDPTHTPTDGIDLIADIAAWILAQGGQMTALQGQVTAEEAHLLAAVKGVQTSGAVDVNALAAPLAAALAPLLPAGTNPDQFVAALAAHLTATEGTP